MAELSAIRPRMEVKSSDGEIVGHVHSTDQGRLMVSPVDGVGVGAGHPVSDDWIARVDEHVHLRHSAAVVRGRWSGSDALPDARPNQEMGKARLPWIIGLVLLAIAVLLLIWAFVYGASSGGDTTRPIPATGQETPSGNGG